jgi:lysophospholipase L1-like esterase
MATQLTNDRWARNGVPAAARGQGTIVGEPPRRGRPIGVAKQIVFCLIIVGGLLLATEAAIRVWALYFRTSYEHYNTRTGRLELVPNLRHVNARGEEFRINSRGFVGPEFDVLPSAGVYRVIAVGDSCTFGSGFWELAYPSMLERRLNTAAAAMRFEVINAGIEGYNSTFALERIRDELLRYRPRLVTIYIGWNDLMKTDPQNTSRADAHPWLAQLLDRSYLVKAYKKLLFVNLRPLLGAPSIADGASDAHAFDAFVPIRYRANLEEMIRLLRRHDVEVLLVTLPTVVHPGMRHDELRRANVFFPYFAGAYGVARLVSLVHAYNRTVVDVGRREGVDVVDLAAVFEAIENRTPYFWDTMHPNGHGHALIAETLSPRIHALAQRSGR